MGNHGDFFGWDQRIVRQTHRRRPQAVVGNGVDLDRCWSDPRRHPYLISADSKLAGFAIVDEGSRVTGAGDVRDMGEFFVLRRYRRLGVGREAAMTSLARFAGPWEIRVLEQNVVALSFWRTVIGGATQNSFDTSTWEAKSGRRATVFSFISSLGTFPMA
jgi:predicted acetyltransferase